MPFTILIIVLVLLFFLAAIILLRTATYTKRFDLVEPGVAIPVDVESAAKHLAQMVRLPTHVVDINLTPNRKMLFELHALIKKLYPRVNATLEREFINEYSLLYFWQGSQPELEPVLLMGHIDVVPVDPANLSEWTYPPFGGEVTEGYIWGRGTLDCKNQVVSILEAVETLLMLGYQPRRSVYLAFGHDEEVGGRGGAAKIVEALQQRNVRLAAVMDEGGSLVKGMLPGIRGVVAAIGTGEKGVLTLELTVDAQSGHSSTPPPHTAIGILAKALMKLEAHPMPVRMQKIKPLLRGASPAASFGLQLVFANLWLLGGVLRRALIANPQTNAIIRTTTAETMVMGGIRDNILPRQARARVNFRLLPGDSIASVCEHVRRVINDERVQFVPVEGSAWEASPESSLGSQPYRILERTVRQVYGATIPVAPYLVTGATDARRFVQLCPNIYRFTPMIATEADLAGVHGTNERISVEVFGQMVQFMCRLIKNWSEMEGS